MSEETDTTNPVVDDAAPLEDSEAAQGVETEDQPELDENDNPIEDQAEDEEEVELDEDLKLKLPKSQAEKLRLAALRQSDYTQKTQELAESRKAFEAERDQTRQMDAVEMMARGDLANVNAQIAQYQQFDWAGARQQAQSIDADNFDRAQMDLLDAHWQQFQLLKDRQQKIGQLLGLKAQERQSKQQQSQKAHEAAVAKLLDDGTPELKKAIPDWSRAKAATLVDDMVKAYGIHRDEFDGIDDARLYMIMNDATAWRKHQAKEKQAASLAKSQEVTPAHTLKGTSGKVPVRADTDDFKAFERSVVPRLKAKG